MEEKWIDGFGETKKNACIYKSEKTKQKSKKKRVAEINFIKMET